MSVVNINKPSISFKTLLQTFILLFLIFSTLSYSTVFEELEVRWAKDTSEDYESYYFEVQIEETDEVK